MGSLLWKVSRMEGTVESMLEGNRMTELITIMDNSLKAFLEVFGRDIPDPCGNEYQFILAWCGILTNVSACPDGRYFLANKTEGQALLANLVTAIGKFSTHNGPLLQRMVLMVIYNLIINPNGLILMQNNRHLIPVLSKTLQVKTEPEIRDLCYKLMYSLTQSIPSIQYLEHLKDCLPIPIIEQEALSSNQSPYQELAGKIINNLKRAVKEMDSHGAGCGQSRDNLLHAIDVMSPSILQGQGALVRDPRKKKYHCRHHCTARACHSCRRVQL